MGALDGKIALVTGASRGIGRAVALAFAREGAQIIATARTQGALEELDDEIRELGGQATLVPTDITNGETIDQMGAAIYERWGKLDILVGNAARLGPVGPINHTDPKEWDTVINTNLTANWRLLRSMDPLLRASDAGRAIFVTSSVGHNPTAYWNVYGVSKAGLEHMVKTYALEITKTNVKANLIDPGATRTFMREKAMPGEDPQTVKPPEDLTPLFMELASADCQKNGELVRAD